MKKLKLIKKTQLCQQLSGTSVFLGGKLFAKFQAQKVKKEDTKIPFLRRIILSQIPLFLCLE